MELLRQFLRDKSGATAIEYGLIASILSVGIIGIVATVGTDLIALYQGISDKMQSALSQ